MARLLFILLLLTTAPALAQWNDDAEQRLGRQQDGEQDLPAARAADAGIDAEMGKVGLAP